MPPSDQGLTTADRRYLDAALRLGRRHLGRTGTNPSVATLIVRDGAVVGRGITAPGGRPHAETIALEEAGHGARGATAYVTLEPCAHHGRTPPCAEALVSAGVARVVAAISDPDDRVAGKGYAILRDAGIAVLADCDAAGARDVLGAYLTRSSTKRAHVTLKLAVSADGMIGRRGAGQVAITGPVARAQSHLMRAEHDAILVGIGTVLEDNPELTCRLEGLEDRSPRRIVLDSHARLPLRSRLVGTAGRVPVHVATLDPQSDRARALAEKGVRIIAGESHGGAVALPELTEDLAAIGVASVLVEGGATVADAFLREGLADRIALFESDVVVGKDGIAAPLSSKHPPNGFAIRRRAVYGPDRFMLLERDD
ncbi:MAG: bifunctional diaminohydroxyphosphoribosylaminopyrimidine deaminase/5-amino-6-(5-phosphoribosylamino)uracil reductase RibD [Roseitalea sp.]|jgi:diaminohydroxyphosphoribosylaminopyrimidine deaminase/5-amino-6-(5-phosphoribosylamino)uracil reductase|nr:bifunctional diaminohydroxyphosphoribosylaminopyrimidine deaminase/5-amino-6-(5-phosphoribosylamino)uracil reductase RibD [Roseitalea sp.]MBO6722817.1 bifunctional diaminohydroxyphosphoribosylaminopyrimidine deaminase/5-amino-6-(5-phosphoribosylamino)uracil reductase RibD [Roseitalea sp.]MBO6743989.1 bifunctional diaminohydroxyphosphoribosylaminopyrimidine deaminase/5-amino-6-(5-phosphoribosylamino)uracil reductase RibD [Roseitalea sp.]